MIITSHMQKIIQIYPCLLKLSRNQESVMDGRYYYIPHRYRGGIIITLVGDSYVLQLLHLNEINMRFYPAMTAFTDQNSLPNIFFDIGQL